jgi:phage terminase large subunit GpA-like protein
MWSNIVWDKTTDEKGKTISHQTETARLECPNCKKTYNDQGRENLVKKGRWVATNPSVKNRRGYWANAFITLLAPKRGFQSWFHYWADRFLNAKKLGPVGLRTFQNLILAETYEVESEKPPEHEAIYARREEYRQTPAGEIILPERILFLVCGADVQQDRIEAEILGIGDCEETWGVEYKIFRGNTETPALFQEFDRWLQKKWKHPSGHELAPACACIDAGNKPEQIYAYVRRAAPRQIYAIRGMRGYTPNWVSRSAGRNQRLFLLKVDTAKEALYSRLRLIEHGPGFCHFPSNRKLGFDLAYFSQLTAESMRTSYASGRLVRYFDVQIVGARNEALDARVYGMAAVQILNPNYAQIAKNLANPPLNDWRNESAPPAPPAPEPEPEPATFPIRPPSAPMRRFPKVRGWARPY